MKINNLKFSNFKYVPSDKSINIGLEQGKTLIMGGSNGYGKTTIFDAIELLITGNINHFKSDLARGKSNFSELANDKTKDICIECEFIFNNNTTIIKRVLQQKEDYTSIIYNNESVITQDELFKLLGININLFHLGVYVSQLDSLNFLQQKYKDRKSSITSILDNSRIESSIQNINNVISLLKEKFESHIKELEPHGSELIAKEKSLTESLKEMISIDASINYFKLFPKNDYIFDKESFSPEDTYKSIIAVLDSLILFITNIDIYKKRTHNINIQNLISIDKKMYTALYFSKEIAECKNNKFIIESSNELLKLKKYFDEDTYYLNKLITDTLSIDEKIVNNINALLDEKSSLEKNLTNTQTVINKLIKNRKAFISEFITATVDSILSDDNCPLCGRQSTDLKLLFEETENSLRNNLGIATERLKDIYTNLKEIFNSEILPKTDKFISDNSRIIQNNNLLAVYMDLVTDNLYTQLKSRNITFSNIKPEVELSDFEQNYSNLVDILKNDKKEENDLLTDENYSNFTRIKNEYYPNEVYHTIEDLITKKHYISSLFSNKMKKELEDVSSQLQKYTNHIKLVNEQYKQKHSYLTVILKKYKDSLKEYETSIANNIDVPMFIFSGKIIQNYPLGLGVSISTDNNSVQFKAGSIDTDIFNNLSTGQLNGVILSLLLSIHEVFAPTDGLNTLLIDDPLQTIDDISAISLIDLLSIHLKESQVILSTHEQDKEFLMRSKYEQSGNLCKVIDMQKLYLDI